MKTILVRITVPDDSYDDVHPDLILEDAQETPDAFEWEIVEEKEQP